MSTSRKPAFFFGLQMELAGLAFHLSWLFLFLYSQAPAGSQGNRIAIESGFSPLYLFSSVALIATLLAFVGFRKKLERLLQERPLTIFGTVATCIGTGLYYLGAPLSPESLAALAPLSGLLTGIGSGIIAMRWAWDFGGVPSATIMASAPSILAVTVAASVTAPHLPAGLTALVVTLLPLASGLFALNVTRTADKTAEGPCAADSPEACITAKSPKADAPAELPTSPKWTASPSPAPDAPTVSGTVSPALFYGLLSAGIALLGVTLGITGQTGTSLFSLNSVTIFLGSAAGAIFIGSGLAIYRNSEASFSANLVVPVIIIGCFLVILASTQPDQLTQNFEVVGNLCLEMLFFAVLVVAARRFHMPAVSVFSAGRVTYALSNMLGSKLSETFSAGASSNSVVQLSSFALLMGIEIIMVAAVVLVVLPQNRRRDGKGKESARAQAMSNGGAVDPDGMRSPATSLDDGTSPSADASSKNSATAGATQHSRAPFQQRTADFAQRYHLTSREAEVAKQLLMGHSYSRVMQELCIAEGTVNYHARNIYAKAGVHSRQELLELFESEQ